MSLQQTLVQKLKDQAAKIATSAKRAQEWFQKNISKLTGNQILSADRPRLITRAELTNKMIGRMVMYYYDPKTKEELPYYDRFPLAIIVKIDNKGFQALNLHYLPYELRAKLLDGLYTIYKGRHLDENKKLRMNYQLLKSTSRTKYFGPCFKQYLHGHVRSKFYVVDPEEWEMVLTLPTERFAKKDKNYVWQESRRKLGIRN